jgi:hypothetical protein
MRNRKPAGLRAAGRVRKREKRRFVIIPPTQPAARDEGPRLIPLPVAEQNQEYAGKIQHYINLADVALKIPSKNRTR